MRAQVISGGTRFSLAPQRLRRRFHYISGVAVVGAAMLGSGAFQPCQSSTMYHYTGKPFVNNPDVCVPGITTCLLSGNITADLVIESDKLTVSDRETTFFIILRGPGLTESGSNHTNGAGTFNLVDGQFQDYDFFYGVPDSYIHIGASGYDLYHSGDSLYAASLKPGTWTSGSPTFSVELGISLGRSASQDDGIGALATARDATGPITLGTAAKELGVDHFNWVQEIISDPDLTACKGETYSPKGSPVCNRLTDISGKVPALPTVDPPLGGWKYQGLSIFPTADFNPSYNDEYFDGAGIPSPSAPDYQSFQVKEDKLQFKPSIFTPTSLDSAMGYLFVDRPGQTNPGTSQFVVSLVGVTGNCNQLGPTTVPCDYTDPLLTFTWTSTNGVITKLRDTTLDPTGEIVPLAPLGCSAPICGEAISLDDALSLTGNTLATFKALGTFDFSRVFAGTPGHSNCHGKSVSALARQYGGLNNAAAALGFASVGALQNAILAFCGG
jgi:hypothetical protein